MSDESHTCQHLGDEVVYVEAFTLDRPEAEYLLAQIEISLRRLALDGTLGERSRTDKARMRLKFSAVDKLGKALARAIGDKEGHD